MKQILPATLILATGLLQTTTSFAELSRAEDVISQLRERFDVRETGAAKFSGQRGCLVEMDLGSEAFGADYAPVISVSNSQGEIIVPFYNNIPVINFINTEREFSFEYRDTNASVSFKFLFNTKGKLASAEIIDPKASGMKSLICDKIKRLQ